MMRIMVTGGAGFGGAGLVRALLLAGHDVTVVDTTGPEEAWRLEEVMDHPHLHYRWQAIQDLRAQDVDGLDAVVHLAAQGDVPLGYTSPRYTAMQNIGGTVALLEAVRWCPSDRRPRMIYAGTAHELEAKPDQLPLTENSPLAPATPYGFSKAAGELACWAWHRSYGVPMTIMSNGVVVGPGMRRDIVFYHWFRQILADRPVVLHGGQQGRDVTYVDDVVQAWMAAIHAPLDQVNGQKFQVSYGEEHTMAELLEWCFAVARHRVDVLQSDYRPGEENMREAFSNEKARNILAYRPEVDPMLALTMTYQWVRQDIATGGGFHARWQ